MQPQDFLRYLERLLGRQIGAEDWVQLSSGQQARVGGWLAAQGIVAEGLRRKLSFPFQPGALLATHPTAILPRPTAAPAPAAPNGTDGLRIGIDIQCIAELLSGANTVDPKACPELTAIFSLREISYAQTRPALRETLAGLFAAKEALRKCDAALSTLPLSELEVLPGFDGRPSFLGYALSISHSGNFAIAVAAAISQSSHT